jgi:AMIN domain
MRCLATLALVAALAGSPAAAQSASPADLTEATIVERDGAVEIWVRLSGEARYQSELMDGPHRLVLDFEDTTYRWVRFPVPIAAEPVRQLRGSQFKKDVARLVVEFSRKVSPTIDADREGLRIVIARPGVAAPAIAPSPAAVGAPPPSVAPPPPVKPAGPGTAATLLVYGIIRLDERRHAYIFDPATRQVRRYAEGDAVGDAVVEAVADRHVVLRTPTGRVELRVEEVRPDAAPRPATAPSGPVKPVPARGDLSPRS